MKSIGTLGTIALASAFSSCSSVKSSSPSQPEKTIAKSEITFKNLSVGDGATPWNFTTREEDVIKRFKSQLDALCKKRNEWKCPPGYPGMIFEERDGKQVITHMQTNMLICSFSFDDADSCDKEPKTSLYYDVNRHISGDIVLGQPNGSYILISENELRNLIKQLQKTMILPADKR